MIELRSGEHMLARNLFEKCELILIQTKINWNTSKQLNFSNSIIFHCMSKNYLIQGSQHGRCPSHPACHWERGSGRSFERRRPSICHQRRIQQSIGLSYVETCHSTSARVRRLTVAISMGALHCMTNIFIDIQTDSNLLGTLFSSLTIWTIEISYILYTCGKSNLPSFSHRFVVNTIFGSERGAIMLEGQRVHPKRTLESGFEFQYPDLKTACEEVVS